MHSPAYAADLQQFIAAFMRSTSCWAGKMLRNGCTDSAPQATRTA
jgi:hypothetical protein